MKKLFYISLILVIYGSLFPFEFDLTPSEVRAVLFWRSWSNVTSIGDILGNIVLFIPIGLFGTLAYSENKITWIKRFLLIFLVVIVAFGCQYIQLYLPERSPSLFDIHTNIIGAFIGFIVAKFIRLPAIQWLNLKEVDRSVPILLVGLWFAAQLSPFVPTIDLQAYKDALKPLILNPQFSLIEYLLLSISWLIIANLSANVLQDKWRDGYLFLAVFITLILKVVIIKNFVTISDAAAALTAIVLWLSFKKILRRYGLAIALSLGLLFIIDALSPFQLTQLPGDFSWIPFSGLLTGSMLLNLAALLQKSFVIGVVLWFIKNSRWNFNFCIFVITLMLLTSEVIQIWLDNHTAETTDPLLVIILAVLLNSIAKGNRQQSLNEFHPAERFERSHDIPTTEDHGVSLLSPFLKGEKSSSVYTADVAARNQDTSQLHLKLGITLAATITAGIFGLYSIVRLPGVPYNVRELFLFDANGIDLFFFIIALLWLGIGCAWAGFHLAYHHGTKAIKAPLYACGISIVLYILMRLGVTKESMSDIAGSSVVVHRVGERGVLGQPGIDFVQSIGADNLKAITDIFEPVIRFGSLVGPVIIFLVICYLTIISAYRSSGDHNPSRDSSLRKLTFYTISFLPWLYLCKVIAFDVSSTDNLNELIARDGEFGLGGGGFLYLLILLIAFSSALSSSHFVFKKRLILGVVITLVSIPAGWYLINAGLHDHIEKYGFIYSGVDFLLGPDRKNLLSETELFLRWSVVQGITTFGLAFSGVIWLKWVLNSSSASNNQTLAINLYADQADTIQKLSKLMRVNNDTVIRLIIKFVRREMNISPSTEKLVLEKLNSGLMYKMSGRGEPISIPVALDPEQLNQINNIASKAGVPTPKAVRRMVDIFMISSELGK